MESMTVRPPVAQEQETSIQQRTLLRKIAEASLLAASAEATRATIAFLLAA